MIDGNGQTGEQAHAESRHGKNAGANGKCGGNGASTFGEGLAGKDGRDYSAKGWISRHDIEPADPLLGHILNATDRAFLIGPTGLGKTMFGIAFGMAIADGPPFLHWKGSGRRRRVVYIDGEMPRHVIIDRLKDEVRRSQSVPETFWFLSREDFEDMPPINLQDKTGRVVGTEYFDALAALYKPDYERAMRDRLVQGAYDSPPRRCCEV